jgi:hypothetical protein
MGQSETSRAGWKLGMRTVSWLETPMRENKKNQRTLIRDFPSCLFRSAGLETKRISEISVAQAG